MKLLLFDNLLAILSLFGQASNIIGAGLDINQGILVQEYWENGLPHYAIASTRKEPVKVEFHGWRDKKAGDLLLGPVPLRSGSIAQVDAHPADGHELMAVRINEGTILGLLRGPQQPRFNSPKDRIVTYYGLNGVGGRRADMWFSQAHLVLPSDHIELEMVVPNGLGTIHFPKARSVRSLLEAVIVHAASDTLPVHDGEQGFTIDSTKAGDGQRTHSVRLRFKAPPLKSTALLTVNGRVKTPAGGGFAILRGIQVRPENSPR
jgi:hypothetical protein